MVNRPRLNVLLAEHLFRWHRTWSEFGELWTDGHSSSVVRCDETDFLTWAGMGLVIEAMQAKGFHYILRDYLGSEEALFQRSDQNCAAAWRAEFLPEAVALAALRAVAPEVAAELEGEGAR